MGAILQRVAMGTGILAAGLIFWLSLGYRSVSKEAFAAMLDERTADLEARFLPASDHDPELAKRLGTWVRAAMDLKPHLGSMRGSGGASGVTFLEKTSVTFTWADRDQILADPEVRPILAELERGGGLDGEISFVRHRLDRHLTHLSMLLALKVSQATATGKEELVVTRFERLVQFAEDLLTSRDPEFGRLGMNVLWLAMTSAHQSSYVSNKFYTSLNPATHVEESVKAMLRVVTSKAGRDRLIAAITSAERRVISPKEGLVRECRRSLQQLFDRVDRVDLDDGMLPYRWHQDLELLIDWQDGVLKLVEDPAPIVDEADLEGPMRNRVFLPYNADNAIASNWSHVTLFTSIKAQMALGKGLIEKDPVQ